MEHFIIGRIINTHGVNGELKVLPLTDDINRYKKLKEVYVEQKGVLINYKVISARINNGFVILKLDNINDMNGAQNLKECYIKIDRANAIKLPKDRYFISDLIDMDVKTSDEYIGKIKEVLQPGGNDVYIVDYNGKDLLIPAVKEFIINVDLENKVMTVKLIEGLKEL